MLCYNNFNILCIPLYICIFKCYKWIYRKSFLFLRWVMLIHMILSTSGSYSPQKHITLYLSFLGRGIFGLFAIFCFSSSAMSLWQMTSWHLLVCVPSLSGVDIRGFPPLQSVSVKLSPTQSLPLMRGQVSLQYSQSPALCPAWDPADRLAGAHSCLRSLLQSPPRLEAAGPPAPTPTTWPSSPGPL